MGKTHIPTTSLPQTFSGVTRNVNGVLGLPWSGLRPGPGPLLLPRFHQENTYDLTMTDDAKDQHREASEQLEDAAIIALPASLASMSDADRAALGRRATVKMDIVIMPILVVMYILNYLDRQNIASAKLANIEEDLGLSDVQYQTSVSILFCGYSESPPPSLMHRRGRQHH